jgi:hypothetical protein
MIPEQTLGHIQYTWEVLSTEHIDTHHQCWQPIHRELTRLGTPEWKFLCVSGEKCLQTIWDDITSEFKDIPYLNLKQRGYSKGDSREGKFLTDVAGYRKLVLFLYTRN